MSLCLQGKQEGAWAGLRPAGVSQVASVLGAGAGEDSLERPGQVDIALAGLDATL